ncbi:MAG: ABC transporter permease [Gemmataceae bacterium]|nr:ABC transporter permease [Gemmataceae bacterium]MCI0738820.1 ABC transporter permease [Gemmataceae bacterium]
MYKLLLCWRYLKTRYLAMACIVSVMLGVATLIVVNSVMSGFSTKLRERLRAMQSDVSIESFGMEGFADPHGKMEKIRQDPFLGPRVEAMTATMEVFAMLQYSWPNGERVSRPVKLVGVNADERAETGGFSEFLVLHKDNPSFALPENLRKRFLADEERFLKQLAPVEPPKLLPPDELPSPAPPQVEIKIPEGIILGNLIASIRRKTSEDHPDKKREEVYFLNPGDTVVLFTVSGAKMKPVDARFVVVDYFKSEMSEYDSNFVFVPLPYLQHLRTMGDRVTSIHVKLKDYRTDARQVVDALEHLFPGEMLRVQTWEQKQGPLLAAIDIEKGILNVLLFLIIAVAGFGILAIFSMIVAEKTRDIGVLKALGASNGGVMKIFLGYGLLLGIVGASFGTILGVLISDNINAVEKFLSNITGGDIFNRDLYYFDKIPTNLEISMLVSVNLGAIGIAVVFSILPALRAALLHPVRALRYE